jgi:hypothetical protein
MRRRPPKRLAHFTLLRESAAGAPPLKIDRANGIIYGVKVLGRTSPNTYGQPGVSLTEYSTMAMEGAAHLYEGIKVFEDHPDRRQLDTERKVAEALGVLRNVRVEADGLRADLHLVRSDDVAESVMNDVERGLGVYGLSHNAVAGKTSIRAGRYVIETIEHVRSVDLVTRPATNRNLWESYPVTTARTLIESAAAKLNFKQKQVVKALLEADDMTDPLAAEASPAASPDDALKGGFEAALKSIVDSALSGDADEASSVSRFKELLKAHGKLTKPDAEPVAEADDEEMPAEGESETEGDEEEDEVAESGSDSLRGKNQRPVKGGGRNQKTQLGAIWKKDPHGDYSPDKHTYESQIAEFKRRDAARDLCESIGLIPSKVQLKALVALDGDERRELAQSFKAASSTQRGPRSVARGTALAESHVATSGALRKRFEMLRK